MSIFNFVDEGTVISNEEAKKHKSSDSFPVREPVQVEILSVEYKAPLKNDATWHGFNLVLGRPGSVYNAEAKKAFTKTGEKSASCYLYLCIPGKRGIEYQGDIGKGVRLAGKFIDFAKACGYDVDFTNLADTIKKLFLNSPSELKGKKLEITRDYKGDYAEYTSDGFVIKRKDGSDHPDFEGDFFEKRDDAIAAYVRHTKGQADISKSYPEIVKFAAIDKNTAGVASESPAQAQQAVIDAPPSFTDSDYE